MRILGLRRRDLAVVAAGCVAVLIAGVAVARVIIDAEMERLCAGAQAEFPGERLAALVSLAQSPRHSLALRNRAVWAIGQLGDARAVEPLRGLLTGGPCDHERFVCQREVRKALSVCERQAWRARLRNIITRVLPAEN